MDSGDMTTGPLTWMDLFVTARSCLKEIMGSKKTDWSLHWKEDGKESSNKKRLGASPDEPQARFVDHVQREWPSRVADASCNRLSTVVQSLLAPFLSGFLRSSTHRHGSNT